MTRDLKKLPMLQRLVLTPNPFCSGGGDDDVSKDDTALCRQYLLSELRGLVLLDTGKVADGEREAADAYLASADGKAALAAMLERTAAAAAIATRPGSKRTRQYKGRRSKGCGQDSGEEGATEEAGGGVRQLRRGGWVRGMSDQEKKRKRNKERMQAKEEHRRQVAQQETEQQHQQQKQKQKQKQNQQQRERRPRQRAADPASLDGAASLDDGASGSVASSGPSTQVSLWP